MLLVLLIIFMVIVPALPHGLDTVLPSKDAGNSTGARPLLVQVKWARDGVSYRIDGQTLSGDELRPRLVQLLGARASQVVLLEGDGALSFDAISGAIDAGHAAGAGTVELITPGMKRP